MKQCQCFGALLCTISLANLQLSSAIEARPLPFTEVQPSGEKILLMAHGDAVENEVTDMDGYLVLQNDLGEYVYAADDESNGGEVYATHELVGTADTMKAPKKKGLHKHHDCFKQQCGRTPDLEEFLDLEGKDVEGERRHGNGRRTAATTGRLKNLVVLMKFKDHEDARRQVPSAADISVLMNADEADPYLCPTGSLKSAYLEMSYGQLAIDSTISPWVVTPQTEAWYADGKSGTTNLHEALRDTLSYLDDNDIINFHDFDEDGDGLIDSITFLHSGYGAEWSRTDCSDQGRENRIWSHKWSLFGDSQGNNVGPWESKSGVKVFNYHISPSLWGTCGSEIGRVGVIAHETGHFLGIPDLYDRNGGGRGLGGFGLMASSWGFDFSQHYPGILSAHTRLELGWDFPHTPIVGTNFIANAEDPTDRPQIYMIGEEFGFKPGEYLLIENRQQKRMDRLLPQGGLAIYHIDEEAGLDDEGFPGQSGWPQNGKHYRVALLQADGFYNLERGDNKGGRGDFFHANAVDELMPSTNPAFGPFPNSNSYQNGDVYSTGVEIFGISVSGDTMSFEFYHPDAPQTPDPSASPSATPSQLPSTAPTRSSTATPTISSNPSVSLIPSDLPSSYPTKYPTTSPSTQPTANPSISARPSTTPTLFPSATPTWRCHEKMEMCRLDSDCCQNKCKNGFCIQNF